jgi:large subunit ribosomal protein L25
MKNSIPCLFESNFGKTNLWIFYRRLANMNGATLEIEKRTVVGGRSARRLRDNGYIPAVVYGRGVESVPAQLKAGELREFISRNGKNSVFTTEFAAENDFSAIIKDIQYDAVTKDVVHVDFQRVSFDEKIHAEVPIRIIGAERLEKGGNVVVHQLNEVTVECLPQDVPPYIPVDVSNMVPGHALTAARLQIPQAVTLITDPNVVILSVTGGKLDLQVNKVDEKVVPKGEEGEVKAVRVH